MGRGCVVERGETEKGEGLTELRPKAWRACVEEVVGDGGARLCNEGMNGVWSHGSRSCVHVMVDVTVYCGHGSWDGLRERVMNDISWVMVVGRGIFTVQRTHG